MKLEFYNEKLKEVDSNIEAIEKSIYNSRYVDFVDKDGNILEGHIDQQITLDNFIAFRSLLIEKIGAMQNSTEMI